MRVAHAKQVTKPLAAHPAVDPAALLQEPGAITAVDSASTWRGSHHTAQDPPHLDAHTQYLLAWLCVLNHLPSCYRNRMLAFPCLYHCAGPQTPQHRSFCEVRARMHPASSGGNPAHHPVDPRPRGPAPLLL